MVSRGLEVILKIRRLGQHFARPCTPSIIVLNNLFVLFQSPFVKTRISCFPITEELYNTTSLIQLSREYLNSSLQSSTIVYLANNKPSILYNNMNWFIKTVVPLILWNIIIFRPINISTKNYPNKWTVPLTSTKKGFNGKIFALLISTANKFQIIFRSSLFL